MSSVKFLFNVISRTKSMIRLSIKASYSPLRIIGPAKAKQMDSHMSVSSETMTTALTAPKKAGP